jgi:hypothetical protein
VDGTGVAKPNRRLCAIARDSAVVTTDPEGEGTVIRKVKQFLTVCALLYFVGHARPAHAELITINASDYSLGTNLSALLFPNLSMSMLGQSGGSTFAPIVSSVFVAPAFPNPAELAMTTTAGMLNYDGCARGSIVFPCSYSVMELRFDTPTDLVHIRGRFNTDAPFMIAYDVLNNPIAAFGLAGPAGAFATTFATVAGTGQLDLTLTRGSGDISRVVYGGDNAVSPTQLSYQVYGVPEPSTVGLVMVGLAAAGLVRRRTRRSRE